MSENGLKIRRIEARDEARWRELFDAYTNFYEREPSDEIARHAWRRIMDPRSPVDAIVAESASGVVGIANYLTHESTTSLAPVCYLQDLFVDPRARAAGAGRRMIEWLIAEALHRGWTRVYWSTRENNYRARALYDKFTPHSGFLRYVVEVPRK